MNMAAADRSVNVDGIHTTTKISRGTRQERFDDDGYLTMDDVEIYAFTTMTTTLSSLETVKKVEEDAKAMKKMGSFTPPPAKLQWTEMELAYCKQTSFAFLQTKIKRSFVEGL